MSFPLTKMVSRLIFFFQGYGGRAIRCGVQADLQEWWKWQCGSLCHCQIHDCSHAHVTMPVRVVLSWHGHRCNWMMNKSPAFNSSNLCEYSSHIFVGSFQKVNLNTFMTLSPGPSEPPERATPSVQGTFFQIFSKVLPMNPHRPCRHMAGFQPQGFV